MLHITKVEPVFDNILIKPLESEKQTQSGILLPETSKEKPQIGEIVAVGAGKKDKDGKMIAMVFKPGQKVLYKKWGGTEAKIKNEDYMIVGQEDILAIVS